MVTDSQVAHIEELTQVFDKYGSRAVGRETMSEAERFLLDAFTEYMKWNQDSDSQLNASIAIVMSERIDSDPLVGEGGCFSGSLNLRDASADEIELARVFLSSANLRMASSGTAAPSTAGDIIAWLVHNGVDDRPTLIALPSENLICWYADGVKSQQCFNIPINGGPIGPENLDEHLDDFHEKWTRYPSGLGNVWHNAGARIVYHSAEDRIRDHLYVYLKLIVYRSAFVNREHMQTNGRVDIVILSFGRGVVDDRSVVLELKVLRRFALSKNSKGKEYKDKVLKEWGEKGIRQAENYKKELNADEGYCCCFDARGDGVDLNLEAYAAPRGVRLKEYAMENSSTH